jgi:menaquinone-dependent protoporphyrinogen IX oxidase
MKKDYEILLATQIRGKWWRVDYINKAGIMEFETVEALDSHEAVIIASNILYRRYKSKIEKQVERKDPSSE